MTAPSFFKNHAAFSKATNYDGSFNGSQQIAFSGGGSLRSIFPKTLGNLCVFIFKDGTTWKIVAGTLSGTIMSWGTPISIGADVDDNSIGLCILSATKCAIYYRNSDATPKLATRVYNISGNALSLDGGVYPKALFNNIGYGTKAICRVSDTRLLLHFKVNGSGFSSVIGLTIGSGDTTQDSSATVPSSSNVVAESKPCNITSVGNNNYLVVFGVTSTHVGRYLITDGTTSTSYVSSTINSSQIQSTDSSAMVMGGAGGVMLLGGGNAPVVSFMTFTSGAINVSVQGSAETYAISPFRGQDVANEANGAYFGDVDGDGYLWSAWAQIPNWLDSSRRVVINFLGFKATATPQNNVLQVKKDLVADAGFNISSNDTVALVGFGSNTFLLLYMVNDSGDKIRSIVGKL